MYESKLISSLLRYLTTMFALVGPWQDGNTPSLSKSLLLQLVDGELSSMESISFEYEIVVKIDKQLTDNPKAKALDGPAYVFYGHLNWVNSGEFRLRTSKADNLSGVQSLQENSLSHGRLTTYHKNIDAPYGLAEITDDVNTLYDWEYTAFDFCPLFNIRAQLEREETALVDEGSDGQSKADLRILRLVRSKNAPPDTGRSLRLWITLDDGIRVRKTELREGKNVMCLTEYTQFQEFAASNRNVWLPVQAEKKSFVAFDRKAAKVVYLDRPRAIHQFKVMRERSIVKADHIAKEIALQLPNGTQVDDHIKKLVYEQGRDLRRSPRSSKESDERLQEYLELANQSEKDVKATSLARSSTPWSYWISGAAAFALVILLLRVLYVRAVNRRDA